MSHLSEFEELNGGYVSFGGNPKGGKITGKGKIKTGKLDFDDVYFVKELKFNLFSVSQICNKKNSVLFTDIECLVLSPDFKLLDESQVLLRVPKKNNMYNANLKNIVLSGDLTCLFVKATIDESNLWHRRLGYINFKNINKLVKGNLVRGLPIKVFENKNTCVACKKGKQHRASCKTKLVIRSDNGTEFKNSDHNQFCGMKGIKQEFSVPRTPQQNGIAERKNMTLIEPARTMLADSLLPIPFWAEAVNTACYANLKERLMKDFWLDTLQVVKPLDFFNSRTRIVQETLHVNFLENKSNVAGSGPTWLFDIDNLTRTMNYQPVIAGNQTNPSADDALDEKEHDAKKPESEVNVSLNNSAQTRKQDDKTKKEAKGKSHVESFTRNKDLSAEFEDCSDNSSNEVTAADTIVPTVGQNSSNSTNPFSAVGPSNSTASPTHGKS
nr:ribonuclease H-like domain-containing protein [Tanacetum cinerariifolium]